jgi:transcriptional regulator with XRE-family HTH domain
VVSILPRSKTVRLGEIIRTRRCQLELTQKEVARRAKISQDYVSYLELGKRRPSETVIKRLANVLDLDGRELFFLLKPRLRLMLTSASAGHLRSACKQFKPASRKMGTSKLARLGTSIRTRRRQLDLTQKEVARRARISDGYVSMIESGTRRPPATIIARLAHVLGLDGRELSTLVRPRAHAMFTSASGGHLRSAWEQFKNDSRIPRRYNISHEEMGMLSSVASLGEVHSTREFIYILSEVRQAISPMLDDHLHSTWKQFKNDGQVRRFYDISDEEMRMLSRVASLGEVHSARDLIYVLNAVRQTMAR